MIEDKDSPLKAEAKGIVALLLGQRPEEMVVIVARVLREKEQEFSEERRRLLNDPRIKDLDFTLRYASAQADSGEKPLPDLARSLKKALADFESLLKENEGG